MEYAIKRSFARRNEQAFAEIDVRADIAAVTINGQVIPATSVEYLLNFAFQSLQDAYAGAKSMEESASLFDKKLEKLMNGTIGTRSAGSGVDEITRVGRIVVGEILRAKNKAKWADLKELSPEDRNDALDEILSENAAKLTPVIMARIEEERARKDRNAGLSLDI